VLAAGAGLLLSSGSVRAGQWEEVTEVDTDAEQLGGAVTQAKLDARMEGSTFINKRGGTPAEGGYDELRTPGWGDWGSSIGGGIETLYSRSIGHSMKVRKDFKLRKLYRWKPDTISIPETGYYGPNKDEKPPKFLRVKAQGWARGEAYSDTESMRMLPAYDETVEASVQGVTATPEPFTLNGTGQKAEVPNKWKLYQKETNGEYLVYSPVLS
jgi:hypothetical protein